MSVIETTPPLIRRKGHDSVSNGKPSVIEKMTSFDETVISDDGTRSTHKKKKKKPAWYRRMEESFCDFAEHTSSHGIPRAYTAPNSVKRALWMILFFLCLGAFCFQAVLIIQRFLRNDIIVGVELKFENIPFPSVTVCNLNPYKNSLARSMASVRDTLLAFDTAIENSNPSVQSRRRKRAIDQEPRLVVTKCAVTTDTGMYYAISQETDFDATMINHVDCYCLHSHRQERNYECAPMAAWEAAECHCTDNNSVCQRFSLQNNQIHSAEDTNQLVPCSCRSKTTWSDELCVVNAFDQLTPSWPLRFNQHRCTCNQNDSPCIANGTATDICLCASPENAESLYCAPESKWTRHKCTDCNWNSQCRRSYIVGHADDAEQECLCHGAKCLALATVTDNAHVTVNDNNNNNDKMASSEAISSTRSSTVRVRRQVHRVYEKIYNRYDGLLAVYSVCDCEDGMCQANKVAANGTICLCFFNRKNGQIWPCYPPDFWSERRCHRCSPLGDCTFAETDGKLPCVCAAIIRMCVRIEESTTSTEVQPFANDNGTSAELAQETKQLPLADRIPKIWEITTTTEAPEPEIAKEKEAAYGFKGVSDPVAIRAKASENLVFAVSSLNETQKSKLSYTKTEMITKCSFNGRQCSVQTDFDDYIDPSFGNCFTFNYNSSENMTSERAGPYYGLRFQVFVNITDYLPTTEAAGVRLTVHSPVEQPFPDSLGYSAPTGFVSSFGIRLKRVNRMPEPYGDCIMQGKTDEYIYRDKEYTTEGCQRSCIQKYLVHNCGCGDPRFPKYMNKSNCPVGNSYLRECLRRELRKAAFDSDCRCPQPCYQQVFSVSYSAARWPASTSSLSDCDPSLTPQQCLQFYREQGAFIEVYFEQLNYESMLESEAYGLPNLLSDFGGQLGLWMGISVISIFEMVILCGELFYNMFHCLLPEASRSDSVRSDRRYNARMSSRRRYPYPPNMSYRFEDALPRPYILNGNTFRRNSPPLPHVESGYDIVRNIR